MLVDFFVLLFLLFFLDLLYFLLSESVKFELKDISDSKLLVNDELNVKELGNNDKL